MNPNCMRVLGLMAIASFLGGCDFVDSGGRQSNEEPVIELDDSVVTEEGTGTLDGSRTTDDFGEFQSANWEQVEGTMVELLPDPDAPVTQTNCSSGISTSTSFRLL